MEKEKIQIDETLQKYEYVFRWCGINIESSKRTRTENVKYTFIYLLHMLQVFREIAFIFYFFKDGIESPQAFEYFILALPGSIIFFLALFKSVWFLVYDKDVNKLMGTLKDFERIENSRDGDTERDKIIKKGIHFLNTVLKVYNGLNWILGLTIPLSPLVQTMLYYSKTNEFFLFFPYVTLCPNNGATDYIIWIFLFVAQSWSSLASLLAVCGTDYFFYISSTYIGIQFRLLQYDFERVIKPSQNNEKFYSNVQFNAKLRKLMKWHQDLISSTVLLEKIYAKSNLFNFCSSSFTICLVGFNIVTMEQGLKSMFFLGCLLQFFWMCLFGDMLKTASMDISNSVYSSRWYLAETSIKKSLLIIMIRAQRPCKVTAFGFNDMDLKLFEKLLNASWSYLALLNQVYNSRRNLQND